MLKRIGENIHPSIFILNSFPTSNTTQFQDKHAHRNLILQKFDFPPIFGFKMGFLQNHDFQSYFMGVFRLSLWAQFWRYEQSKKTYIPRFSLKKHFQAKTELKTKWTIVTGTWFCKNSILSLFLAVKPYISWKMRFWANSMRAFKFLFRAQFWC